MPRYFKKTLLSNKLCYANGHLALFHDVGGDEGVMATSDPYVIEQLEAAIKHKVGGVSEISEALWDELKKKALTAKPKSLSSSLNTLSGQTLDQLLMGADGGGRGVVAKRLPPVVHKSAPLVVPENLPVVRPAKLPPLNKPSGQAQSS